MIEESPYYRIRKYAEGLQTALDGDDVQMHISEAASEHLATIVEQIDGAATKGLAKGPDLFDLIAALSEWVTVKIIATTEYYGRKYDVTLCGAESNATILRVIGQRSTVAAVLDTFIDAMTVDHMDSSKDAPDE